MGLLCVVIPPEMFPSDEDIWDSPLASHLLQKVLDLPAIS